MSHGYDCSTTIRLHELKLRGGLQRVTRAFKRAEELKETLKKRYGEELEIWKAKEAERVVVVDFFLVKVISD